MAKFDDRSRPHAIHSGPPEWKPTGRRLPPLVSDEAADFELLVEIIHRRIRSPEKCFGLALALIDRYKHFAGILTATEESLRGELAIPEKLIQDVKRYHLVAMKLYRQPLQKGPVLSSSAALHTYLYARMAHLTVEQIRLLFLDTHHRLIRDETHQLGTPNHVPVQISEIAKKAVLYDAKKLIIAHNHPSGDSSPSPADISLTEQLNITLSLLGVELTDHLIIGSLGSISMRALGHV
jgi:DNA repair protein RadC